MNRFQRSLAFAVMSLIIGGLPAFGADFYENQLKSGISAASTGRLPEAINHFRVANFGLLDRPVLLVEGTVRLALAQSAAGRREDVQSTLDRFVTVEREFPSYASANLEPELRAQFEKLLLAAVPKDVLRAVPSLTPLLQPKGPDLTAMTPEQRRSYYESQAKTDPTNPAWPLAIARDRWASGDARGTIKACDRVLKIDPANNNALALKLDVQIARKEYSAALGTLGKLSAESWAEIPSVVPDAFVAYVKTGAWDSAAELVARLPESSRDRADVAAAFDEYNARVATAEAAKAAAAAAATAASAAAQTPPVEPPPVNAKPPDAASAAPDPAAAPAGSPVEAPGDTVDARINAPRGSFTTAPDAVGDTLAQARRLIQDSRPAEAQRVIRDALKKNPASRELRLAMIEASCLSRDWPTGMAQLSLVEPFKKGEERFMFYSGVVLYESGKIDEGKPLILKSVPALASSPFVDHYAKLAAGGQ